MSYREFSRGFFVVLAAGLACLVLPEQSQAQEQRYKGRAIAEWTRDLQDLDPSVRSKAAEALGHFGRAAEPAVPALIRLFAQTLKDMRALDDDKGMMGLNADDAAPLLALKRLDRIAVSGLMRGMGDADLYVLAACIMALEQIGPNARDAIASLIRAFGDPAMIRALKSAAGGKRFEPSQNVVVSMLAGKALAAIGREAAPPLRKLADRQPELRPMVEGILREIEGR